MGIVCCLGPSGTPTHPGLSLHTSSPPPLSRPSPYPPHFGTRPGGGGVRVRGQPLPFHTCPKMQVPCKGQGPHCLLSEILCSQRPIAWSICLLSPTFPVHTLSPDLQPGEGGSLQQGLRGGRAGEARTEGRRSGLLSVDRRPSACSPEGAALRPGQDLPPSCTPPAFLCTMSSFLGGLNGKTSASGSPR